MNNNSTGLLGEKYITKILIDKGYHYITSNYHSRYGEIDIIVRDEKYLVFVEVKTRDINSESSPFESVTISKQKKIIKTAEQFLQTMEYKLQPRFDVAAVYTKNKKIIAYDYVSNAF